MNKVKIGSEVEHALGDIEILNLQDVWVHFENSEDIAHMLERKGCKSVELDLVVGCREADLRYLLKRVNEVIELSEKYDIYDIACVERKDWLFLVAVPRDCVVVLGEDMYTFSPENLVKGKKGVIGILDEVLARESEEN